MKDQRTNISFHVSSIEFFEMDTENLSKKFKTQLNYDYEIIKDKIKVNCFFKFIPEAIMHGKVVFLINTGEESEITSSFAESMLESIKPQLAHTASFLATVCGDVIYGNKIIIPPTFIND